MFSLGLLLLVPFVCPLVPRYNLCMVSKCCFSSLTLIWKSSSFEHILLGEGWGWQVKVEDEIGERLISFLLVVRSLQPIS